MGFFSKLFKGPEIDLEKSAANAARMRELFDAVVPEGGKYRLIFGYTEDVSRFNYGFVHGSKTKIGNLIVGWNEAGQRKPSWQCPQCRICRAAANPPSTAGRRFSRPAGTSTPPMPL